MSTEKWFMTERPRPAVASEAPAHEFTEVQKAYWRGVMQTVGEFDPQKARIRLVGKKSFLTQFAQLLDRIGIIEVGEPWQDKRRATEKAAYYKGVLDADPPSDAAEKARLGLNADPEAWYQLVYEADKAKQVAEALALPKA